MEINLDYIRGVVETTHNFYELENGRIELDKDLEFNYEPLNNSQGTMVIGAKVTFTWKTWVSSKWDKDSELSENYIKILHTEKLESFISDISSTLSDIHKASISY